MIQETIVSNFIGNEYKEPVKGEYIDSFNPSTGKVHAVLPNSTKEDVDLAVEAASEAFKTWSKTTRAYRSSLMLKVAELLESRIDVFAALESSDQGKPVWFAKQVDINRTAYNFRYFATYILHSRERINTVDGVATNFSRRHPVGVAGLISPWNLPLYLLTWKIAPCIAFGNTCVCKPSEFTSLTAHRLCSVLLEAGLPKGVVNMVFGFGGTAGQALVEHPKVPLISFTGGTVTGRKINMTCASQFKKVSLEMGGKNANVIFDDCDFDDAVDTSIRAAFSNQGEICLCGSRIFVQKGIYDRFLESFVAKAKELQVGDPSDPKTKLGPLVSKEHLEKVSGYIDVAKGQGGKIECGGGRLDTAALSPELQQGYYCQPTVITGLTAKSRCAQEEIFGPVVTIHTFETEQEAIDLANDCQYGLACSIWTENGKRARRVADSIEAGYVWVNCWMVRDLSMPFGGMKHSGKLKNDGILNTSVQNFFVMSRHVPHTRAAKVKTEKTDIAETDVLLEKPAKRNGEFTPEPEDPTVNLFLQPRMLTVLISLLLVLLYVALHPDLTSPYTNLRLGFFGAISCFILIGTLMFRDGPFVRPHPAFWRGVLSLSVLYQMGLVFLLFQDKVDARKLMTYLSPELGVELPERSYAENCDLTWDNITGAMDIFVVAHVLGWYGKALILRDYWFCWILSVMFEVMEYSLMHQLNNFAECWWDHWVLDVLVCNWAGIYFGMKTCEYFEVKHYSWRGFRQIKTFGGKAKRAFLQFTPSDWTKFEWRSTRSFKNFLAVIGLLVIFLQCELNCFYLKYLLWVPPEHPLNTYRVVMIFLFALPATREVYQYLTDKKCTRFGPHAWLCIANIMTETIICVKFGQGEFPNPAPLAVKTFWTFFVSNLTLYTLWQFWWRDEADDADEIEFVGSGPED